MWLEIMPLGGISYVQFSEYGTRWMIKIVLSVLDETFHA